MGINKIRGRGVPLLIFKSSNSASELHHPATAYRKSLVRSAKEPIKKGGKDSQQQKSQPQQQSQKPSTLKSVSFKNVIIREYTITFGDHPCCTNGYPVTLDWEFSESSDVSIDQYEEERGPRRSRDELKLTPEVRCELLTTGSGSSTDGDDDCSIATHHEMRKIQRQLYRERSSRCTTRANRRQMAAFFRDP